MAFFFTAPMFALGCLFLLMPVVAARGVLARNNNLWFEGNEKEEFFFKGKQKKKKRQF